MLTLFKNCVQESVVYSYKFLVYSEEGLRIKFKALRVRDLTSEVCSLNLMNIKKKLRNKLGELIALLATSGFAGVLPLKIVFENEKIIAFHHPQPNYKVHVIILPKKRIQSLDKLQDNDSIYIDEIFKNLREIIKALGIEKSHSLIVNGGDKQDIKQLHFHLISSK